MKVILLEMCIRDRMKNRHLSKAVASQKFYEFRTKLKAKCDEKGIELRVVDTVSYTHLDVYKRQVLSRSAKVLH